MEENQFLKECHILFKKYIVLRKIGKEDFCEIYLGRKISDKKLVSIKVEKKSILKSLLEAEAFCYCNIKGVGIPKPLSFGVKGKYNVLVTPLLGKHLYDIYLEKGEEFDLGELCMIALQVLERIIIVHSHFYIHRNIKPDVFFTRKEDPNIIYLTNFSLVSKYRSSRTKKHILFRNTGKFYGTLRFSSPNALKGGTQSRKDDLISIGYMLIYFLRKKLPWQYIKAQNPTDKYIKIYRMKKEIKP